MSFFLLPLILIIIAIIVFFSVVMGAVGAVGEGGVVEYDYDKHSAYMDEQYAAAFDSTSSHYEQNIVISFLINDDCNDYYVATWAGSYLAPAIDGMLRCDGSYPRSVIEQACVDNISNSNFKGSFVYEVSRVVDTLTERIVALGLDSSFEYNTDYMADASASAAKNNTEAANDSALTEAVQNFTAQTGIGLLVTVDTMAAVLGADYSAMILGIVIIVVLVGLAAFFIVRSVMNYRKRKEASDGGGYNNGGGNVYSDF